MENEVLKEEKEKHNMHKFLDCRYNDKRPNPIYNSFWGGNAVGGKNSYDWHCLWDKLRITADNYQLIDGWRHHSIHWNNVKNGGIAWNFHWGTNIKFPFIKIGFKKIRDLYKEF